ncbi:putative protein with domain of unknown function (DUF4419) [Lyophyllum shimeji]|uniref:Uncharacterized protein n=1 Tax=Lyophyllum shimeji TaxID=47721 RepID=A0A9P3URX5_LYOSH|nr:putative protein with domain of unknown function (DUF4419) [Lyophyllum shimeji]
MPVTFPVADRPADAYSPPQWRKEVRSNVPDELLANLPTTHHPARLLQSSVDRMQPVIPKKNGFVLGVVEAYNHHHHLVIRPDDVWIAILSQLNFYINAHAKELRDKFVDHEEKRDLVVTTLEPSLDKADFGDLAVQMAGQIDQNVKDKTLVPWVLPNFSTTTRNDTVICSALIMSTLKEYFRYIMMLGCGIPSITLEGTQADWQSILTRIDKIPSFGAEPAEWASMLRAVLKRFVRAFNPGGPKADKKFWERMVHERPGGSNTPFISGWITAFCAWDPEGVFFAARKRQSRAMGDDGPAWVKNLTFDGVWFPRVWRAPEGYAEVDVKVLEVQTGNAYDCTMLAGHVGIVMQGKERLDTVRPAPLWFMYVKGAERKPGSEFWM